MPAWPPYASAILVVKLGLGLLPAVLFGGLLGALAGLLLSIPLGRLRGVYQAIATLAFVQIILSLALWAEALTGGAMGMNNLPKLAGVPVLLLAAAMVFASVWALSTTSIGRIFDIIRRRRSSRYRSASMSRPFSALPSSCRALWPALEAGSPRCELFDRTG